MGLPSVTAGCKFPAMNRDGFTFLAAIFMVMIIGIMLGLTGQSWKMIMKREREKELLFRGSQIKEAIENWYDTGYKVPGVTRAAIHPLTDLKHLMEDPNTLTPIRYLPHTYATELDGKSSRCAPDCPKLKVYEDPMTGKEWEVIKCDVSTTANPLCLKFPGSNIIIGVASKSDEEPFKTDFKDTALENMGVAGVGTTPSAPGTVGTVSPVVGAGTPAATPGLGGKMKKYSEWKFIADTNNDHKKIYRAYHEGW
jgi:type II secretory pathway pseudopilin PulG